MREIVCEYGIPIGPFEALISAFRRIHRSSPGLRAPSARLLDYCTPIGQTRIGHLVLYLAREFDEENARLSDCTCTGLQLANFWQDVARDLDIPRVYLPREDRERFGYSDADLHARRFTPAFRELLAYEVGRARALLLEGRELVPRLPRKIAASTSTSSPCRAAWQILDRIEGQGFDDLVDPRPEVGKLAKVGLLLRAMLARPGRRGGMKAGRPLAESRA